MSGEEERQTGVQEGSAPVETREEQSPSQDGAQVESSEGQEEGGHQERPSRAQARIQQLARRNRQLEGRLSEVSTLSERLEAMERALQGRSQPHAYQDESLFQSSAPAQRGPDLVAYIKGELEKVEYSLELKRAESYIRGQDGYNGDEDYGLMQAIAQENGWDTLSKVEPMRAAELIVKAWRREKGMESQKKVPPKSQAASVQGSAPRTTSAPTLQQLNERVKNLPLDPVERKKQLDAIFGSLTRPG